MKHFRHHLLVGFFVICLASTCIAAQITFLPGISATTEFIDNIYLTNENTQSDFITTIGPNFNLGLEERRTGLELSYEPSYAIYNQFSENNTWRHAAHMYGWVDFARSTRLEIRDSFLYTEALFTEAEIESLHLEEPMSEEDTTIRRERNTYFTNTSNIRLTHQFGVEDTLYFQYQHGLLENDDPTVEDNQSHQHSFGLIYWFIPHWGMDTEAVYLHGDFDSSDDFDEWICRIRVINRFARNFEGFVQYQHLVRDYMGSTEDYQVYDPSAGVNYQIAEDAELDVRIGYFIQDRKESDDESGLYIDGNIGKTWTNRRSSADINIISGYGSSDFGAENLGFNTYYGASCTGQYGITRHLTAQFDALYQRTKYINLDTDRTDDRYQIGIGLQYEPFEWMTIRGEYSFRVLNTNVDQNDYKENRLFLSITLQTAQNLRLNP